MTDLTVVPLQFPFPFSFREKEHSLGCDNGHHTDSSYNSRFGDRSYNFSDEQLQGDLQSWKLEETSQPMNLHLLQARSTYSSLSTLFGGIYLYVNYARRFTMFHDDAEKNYVYALSITHLSGDVKKNNLNMQFHFEKINCVCCD